MTNMPNIITQSVIKAKNQNSKKNRQPSGPRFGSVYNSVTSVCFCMQKPSGNCLDNSIIA